MDEVVEQMMEIVLAVIRKLMMLAVHSIVTKARQIKHE